MHKTFNRQGRRAGTAEGQSDKVDRTGGCGPDPHAGASTGSRNPGHDRGAAVAVRCGVIRLSGLSPGSVRHGL